jgi:8-oxo-dGTP pyrophosphatase MutT (NUDIX family)
MIRHKTGGYRSFPKGHVEAGEDEHATAVREVAEETSVNIRIRSSFRETVYYSPAVGVLKEVVYFLAFTDQVEIAPREGEIAEVEWIPIEKAEASLSHENDRVVLRSALKRIGNPLGEQ